jgi:hypothetical protein
MPFWLILTGAGLSGAYLGTVADDFTDWWGGGKFQHPASGNQSGEINWTKVALYAGMGLALVWGARKAGVIK